MLIRHFRPKATLIDCLTATVGFRCKDPRDHLYSLLSLSDIGATLEPDYDISVEQMCKNFAVTTLVTDQNLKILSLVKSSPPRWLGDETPPPILPSWALDLTALATVNPLISYTIRTQLFHAGGSDHPLVRVSEDKSLLYLKGRIVDKFKAKARAMVDIPFPTEKEVKPFVGFSYRIKMWVRNWLQESRDTALHGKWSNATAEQKHTFYRTVICGMGGMRDPVSEEMISAVGDYMEYLDQFWVEGYVLTEENRDLLLTHGGNIDALVTSISGQLPFCTTEGGRMARVQREAQPGDLFCVILGAEVPHLIRPTIDGKYKLIGECYFDGIMQGEALLDPMYKDVDIVLE